MCGAHLSPILNEHVLHKRGVVRPKMASLKFVITDKMAVQSTHTKHTIYSCI